MKILLLSVLLSTIVIAADKPTPKPEPIPIFGSKRMATFDPSNGKVKYEDGVSPDDVVYVLIQDLNASTQQFQQCQKELGKFQIPPVLNKGIAKDASTKSEKKK